VAWLNPGDEVILFEPYFAQYIPSITFNAGVPVYVPLHPPTDFHSSNSNDWKIDFEELRRAITPKTKAIVVNNPHNPVGKVFTQEELQKIADLAIEYNLIVMSDEVVSNTVCFIPGYMAHICRY
jgi:kynurenine aminotransferase